MFFQLDEIRIFLFVIVGFLKILGYVFIVIFGAFNFKREEKVRGSIFFVIIGALEIIYELLEWRLYGLIPVIMDYSVLSYWISYAIMYIIPYIISLTTFGILIIILGKRNKENYGKSLLLSGIFWIIYSSILLITNIYGLFKSIVLIRQIVLIIVIAFAVVSMTFFVLYSSKIKEKKLLIASVILLTASIIFIFYTIIEILYLISIP